MALELAIGALKMLYQLAKMVKEARDNVIIIRNRLDSTDSIQNLLEQAVGNISDEFKEGAAYKELIVRLAKAKKTGRRMRMKYEPLLNLLNGLGGDASILKASATRLRKGLSGVTMAIGTVSKM